jgi:hypothetical protein
MADCCDVPLDMPLRMLGLHCDASEMYYYLLGKTSAFKALGPKTQAQEHVRVVKKSKDKNARLCRW